MHVDIEPDAPPPPAQEGDVNVTVPVVITPPPTPEPEPADSPLISRLDSLEARIADLQASIEAMNQAPAEEPSPVLELAVPAESPPAEPAPAPPKKKSFFDHIL